LPPALLFPHPPLAPCPWPPPQTPPARLRAGADAPGLPGAPPADAGVQAGPGQEHPPRARAHPPAPHPVGGGGGGEAGGGEVQRMEERGPNRRGPGSRGPEVGRGPAAAAAAAAAATAGRRLQQSRSSIKSLVQAATVLQVETERERLLGREPAWELQVASSCLDRGAPSKHASITHAPAPAPPPPPQTASASRWSTSPASWCAWTARSTSTSR
jgi:hypothetical protein